ncbi:dihydrofolate reductase [Alteribacter populi]|uniref:dihydrofolate reductase n=1 Tax=Alteribacter populi TaxID=2011011 RepID=UPI000BBB4DD1|nr:dihydrofolate reductase [Alteribacter populi]
MISMIAAMDENNLIGVNNELPWSLPNDLAFFKRVTTGHTVVMGRKTYESIGKALPNRRNVVISRNTRFQAEGVEVVTDLEDVKNLASQNEEIMILGGQKIFEQLMEDTDRLYITRVHHSFDGDTYFPSFSEQEWEITETYEGKVDDRNQFPHTFYVYDRKK